MEILHLFWKIVGENSIFSGVKDLIVSIASINPSIFCTHYSREDRGDRILKNLLHRVLTEATIIQLSTYSRVPH